MNTPPHPSPDPLTEKKVVPSIDRGNFGGKHPKCEGITFSDLETAQHWASCNGHDPDMAFTVDTRPTVKAVLNQIIEAENQACSTPEQGEVGCAGPWDEYIQCSSVSDEKFPDIHVHVEVTFGSNEGIYLSIYQQREVSAGGKRIYLITGKTCGSSWEKWRDCHLSAARIGWMLNR